MFGFSFGEVLVVAIIAIICLGPEKFPETVVKIAKLIKGLKNTINNAKDSIEQEVKFQDLKEDAKKYKESLENITGSVRKKLTFEELDELKQTTQNIQDNINKDIENIKEDMNKEVKKIKEIENDVKKEFSPKSTE